MATKRCQHCGVVLHLKPGGHMRRYCSKRCQGRHSRNMPTHCVCCSKPLAGKQRKFCSKACDRLSNVDRNRFSNEFFKLLRHKMTVEKYETSLLAQDGRCAICRKPETIMFRNQLRRLSVDHCHETNQIRGLLCARCNLAIGQFNDDWLLLDNAMEYLAYWHGKHGSSKVQSIQEVPALN